MSIPDHARANFATLLRAAADGNLALMECTDAVTGEARYVICAVGRDGTDFVFTPFGHLADGNPFDAYVPPSATLPDEPASAAPLAASRFNSANAEMPAAGRPLRSQSSGWRRQAVRCGGESSLK